MFIFEFCSLMNLVMYIIWFDEGEGFLISWPSVNANESSEGFLGFLSGGQL